jgi:hypothetical protein
VKYRLLIYEISDFPRIGWRGHLQANPDPLDGEKWFPVNYPSKSFNDPTTGRAAVSEIIW